MLKYKELMCLTGWIVEFMDRAKTTFRRRYGHNDWAVMPMGLCNSPARF
jgi:hypothetical protein